MYKSGLKNIDLPAFTKFCGRDGRVLFQVKPVETNKSAPIFFAFRIAIALASVF